jgi:hypothetical protein
VLGIVVGAGVEAETCAAVSHVEVDRSTACEHRVEDLRRVVGVARVVFEAEMIEPAVPELHAEFRLVGPEPAQRLVRLGRMAVAVTHAAGLDERIPGVRVDIEAGARLAMHHVLGLGHRRIAYVGNLAGAGEARHSAYREVLAEEGIGYDATLTYGVEPTARSGAEVAAQISATAVFAFNDGDHARPRRVRGPRAGGRLSGRFRRHRRQRVHRARAHDRCSSEA